MKTDGNEIVLFEEKPNVFFYAVEASRAGFIIAAVAIFASLLVFHFKGIRISAVTETLILIVIYLFGNFCLFFATVCKACFITIVATNRRAIVRLSIPGISANEGLSIPIEAIERIETNSYGATYGSVYLRSNKFAQSKKCRCDESSESATLRYAGNRRYGNVIPVKRTVSIWCSISFVIGMYGFYGFKRFDEFACIVSEQCKRRAAIISENL